MRRVEKLKLVSLFSKLSSSHSLSSGLVWSVGAHGIICGALLGICGAFEPSQSSARSEQLEGAIQVSLIVQQPSSGGQQEEQVVAAPLAEVKPSVEQVATVPLLEPGKPVDKVQKKIIAPVKTLKSEPVKLVKSVANKAAIVSKQNAQAAAGAPAVPTDNQVSDGNGAVGAGTATAPASSVEAGKVDLVPIRRVSPQYPASALRRGIEGKVRLQVLVNAEGGVDEVTVLEATPAGIFEREAVRAVAQWYFAPPKSESRSVRATQTIQFSLRDSKV